MGPRLWAGEPEGLSSLSRRRAPQRAGAPNGLRTHRSLLLTAVHSPTQFGNSTSPATAGSAPFPVSVTVHPRHPGPAALTRAGLRLVSGAQLTRQWRCAPRAGQGSFGDLPLAPPLLQPARPLHLRSTTCPPRALPAPAVWDVPTRRLRPRCALRSPSTAKSPHRTAPRPPTCARRILPLAENVGHLTQSAAKRRGLGVPLPPRRPPAPQLHLHPAAAPSQATLRRSQTACLSLCKCPGTELRKQCSQEPSSASPRGLCCGHVRASGPHVRPHTETPRRVSKQPPSCAQSLGRSRCPAGSP